MNPSNINQIWDSQKTKIDLYVRNKVKNDSDVDDITQEIFIKLWTNYSTIRNKDKILNWLYGVARYTIADHFRSKAYNPSINVLYGEFNFSEIDMDEGDESRKLLPIIYSLPAKYKNILLLSDICGIPHKAIASHFNLSLACVKTRVIRARSLLVAKMHENCKFSYDNYGNIIDCQDKPAYIECLKNHEKMPPFSCDSDNKE